MTHHKIIIGHCLEVLREMPSESVNMIMTSPPYWGLRNYGEGTSTIWGGNPNCEHEWVEERMTLVHENRNFQKGSQEAVHGKKGTTYIKKFDDKSSGFCQKCGAWYGQLGLEPSWGMYVEHLVEISRELKRVLRKDGSYYLNLGDTYGTHASGSKSHGHNFYSAEVAAEQGIGTLKKSKEGVPDGFVMEKQKLLIPYRVAIALQEDGWICRNDITWYKRNSMPSPVKDRLTCKTERVFHFVKSRKYWYDLGAIRVKWTDQRKSDIKRAIQKHPGYHGKYGRGYNAEYRELLPGQGIKGQPVGDPRRGKNPGDICFVDRQQAYRHHGSGPGERSGFPNKHPSGKNPGDFWEINTRPYPDAHFATYPEEICIKPILSSCPEWVCKKCGKPRERITKSRLPPLKDAEIKGMSSTQYGAHNAFSLGQRRQAYRALGYESPPAPETIGFTDCGCGAGFEPGVVLDLFLGRGTTTKVARDNGRNSIGIEIQPSYLPIIKKYLEIDQQRLGVMYEIIGAD